MAISKIERLKLTIQEQLVQEFDASFFLDKTKREQISKALKDRIEKLIDYQEKNKTGLMINAEEKQSLIKEIMDDIMGYGPVDDLMKDETVTEIMINGPDKIYIERNGKKILSNVRFKDTRQLMHLIQRLIAYSGRKVDETTPYVDASLENQARVNVILPPLSLHGPAVTIRKRSNEFIKMEDLVNLGTLTEAAGQFLIACVKGRMNMIFSGATGVGKTTTLGVLTYYIYPDERIVVIEDTAELTFRQDDVVRLQVRLPNIEGRGEVTMRDLLKNALRMRPERIIIGEVRGSEALDLLQAMASGHSGALGVVHAASPQDVISRLETMIATSGVNIPLWTIRKYIVNNLNIIVQQDHLPDGSRKIVHISEVRGIKRDEIILEDIFTFVQEGFDKNGAILGRLKSTGVRPLFLSKLEEKNIKLDPNIFTKEV